jgi:hypothetical protein
MRKQKHEAKMEVAEVTFLRNVRKEGPKKKY